MVSDNMRAIAADDITFVSPRGDGIELGSRGVVYSCSKLVKADGELAEFAAKLDECNDDYWKIYEDEGSRGFDFLSWSVDCEYAEERLEAARKEYVDALRRFVLKQNTGR